ncbi:MAG: YbbR-like domain-containing protein [Chitinophagaceae bacterium]|nr:YbbR-like domain-containing protein [Chitinophagaceae bacterium]
MNTSSSKYSSDKKKPGKTKAFFICLIIASFLWLVHSLNTVYTYTLKIPVAFKNQPQNKKPLFQIPEHLSLDVKASGLKLALILLNRPFKQLEIDFNALKSVNRDQNYVLSSSHLNFKSIFNFETQIKHISPDTLYFSEKNGYQKNVPVKVPLYMKCMEGFGYKKPAINPSFVTLWGDSALISKVDTIYTQALTLSNLNKSVSTQLELLKPDPQIYTSSGEASIFIEVARLVEQTIVLPVTDIHGSYQQHVSIFPSTVKVKFTAIQNSFNPEDTSLFRAMIDSEKINKLSKKCPVFLSTFPGHVTIMHIEPPEVEILIFKK